MEWENSILTKAIIQSTSGGKCKVRYKEKITEFDTTLNQKITLRFDDFIN